MPKKCKQARQLAPTKTSAEAYRVQHAEMCRRALAYLNDTSDERESGADAIAAVARMLECAWDEGYESALAAPDPCPDKATTRAAFRDLVEQIGDLPSVLASAESPRPANAWTSTGAHPIVDGDEERDYVTKYQCHARGPVRATKDQAERDGLVFGCSGEPEQAPGWPHVDDYSRAVAWLETASDDGLIGHWKTDATRARLASLITDVRTEERTRKRTETAHPLEGPQQRLIDAAYAAGRRDAIETVVEWIRVGENISTVGDPRDWLSTEECKALADEIDRHFATDEKREV